MSTTDHYFTFPLAALRGIENASTPLTILDLCLDCGIVSAGVGYRKNHKAEEFKERLTEACNTKSMATPSHPKPNTDHAVVIVGAAICGVRLAGTSASYCDRLAKLVRDVPKGGPLVRMSAKSFWSAFYQAEWESDPDAHSHPDRGMSFTEFRILAAILSVQTNSVGFAFVGWEFIQARSCGFSTKQALKDAETIPDHLAPPLTRRKITPICEALEDLGFYARFRFSKGKRGGKMAYSFRHNREELGDAVCGFINFRDRSNIRANRAKDAEKCLAMLERCKVGTMLVQGLHKGGDKGGTR